MFNRLSFPVEFNGKTILLDRQDIMTLNAALEPYVIAISEGMDDYHAQRFVDQYSKFVALLNNKRNQVVPEKDEIIKQQLKKVKGVEPRNSEKPKEIAPIDENKCENVICVDFKKRKEK